jgi:hypothetical protein
LASVGVPSAAGMPAVPTIPAGAAARTWLSSMGLRLGMDIPGWPPENIEEMAKKLEQELLG